MYERLRGSSRTAASERFSLRDTEAPEWYPKMRIARSGTIFSFFVRSSFSDLQQNPSIFFTDPRL
jgi:hypothetical protein